MTIRMKLAASALAAMLPVGAMASTVDFDTGLVQPAPGAYLELPLPGASLRYAGGTFYAVDSANPSATVSGMALTGPMPDPDPDDPNPPPYVGSSDAFRIDFTETVNSVEVSFGDYCGYFACDTDTAYLQAWDSTGTVLLGETMLADLEGGVLSLLVAGVIDHVLFWSTSAYCDENGDNCVDGPDGSVYWDNLRYGVAEVPLPGTLGLMGLGLMGLGLVRRKAA